MQMKAPSFARPALQDRSRKTRDRLLAAGLELFSARDFNGIAIAEITQLARCSIGGFYDRFTSKELFFGAVLRELLSTAETELEELIVDVPIADLGRALVGFHLELVRRHPGIFRSAVLLSTDDIEVWTPIRELATMTLGGVTRCYEHERGVPLAADQRLRAHFVCELLFSTLLAMVVGRAGPVTLYDPGLPDQLNHALKVLFDSVP
jgi:AcrR family transcriptional regulator